MMPSLFSGVTGLKNHQVMMDTIGNNIANINTVGYKRSRVAFQDLMSNTLSNASAPQSGELGGRNPIQVGLGAKVGSIDTIFTNGSPQVTGRDSDISIDGEGMFMVGEGKNTYYTRAGNFGLDSDGFLVASNGMKVQGWQATKKSDGTTEIAAGAPIGNLDIKLGEVLPAKATSVISYAGNLNADGGLSDIRLTVDADGNGTGTSDVDVSIKFTYDVDNDRWNWSASNAAGSTSTPTISGSGYMTLDADGNITGSVTSAEIKNDSNGKVLIDVPTNGKITFKEKIKSANTSTSKFVTNKIVNSSTVYDSEGATHALSMEYTKIDENMWKFNATEGDGLDVNNGKGFMTFDSYGQFRGAYTFAETDSADSTKLGTITDSDGTSINSYPSQTALGITTDSSVKANYLLEGEDASSKTAPYYLDNRGVIKYRGATDSDGNGIPDKDKYGNTIDEITLTSIPEEGEIMNNAYSGSFSFDPGNAGGALPPDEGAELVSIQPDFIGVNQFHSDYGVKFTGQDGYGMGELSNFRFTDNGDIIGEYSNEYKQIIGRISIAKFFNPAGLAKIGSTMFTQTSNSGEAQVVRPGTSASGTLAPGKLEMSNVDLAQEFTDMIIAQRGFQANSKTISTADQLLQDLISLKR
ncbi:flagellar hook protein FlgE [Haliovirga abyssi]|uniref:Flagellar hook protein FlgE n=1 Tax=Haliovirga abyssi TaxID=2996794 RepID=A0AAU9D9W4_9FUSO|nr:flagellar hook protein FlgE [Haliovirga abyssi]BDU50110.1 hypothetical protein HLVA_06790 [Haliovirga abyssi]